MSKLVRVGITHGDINGISYEILLKLFSDERITELCTPIIFGSAKLMAYFKKHCGIDNFHFNQIKNASEAQDGCVNLVNISNNEFKLDLGQATKEGGAAALLALEMAVESLKTGLIDVLVTSPINKHAIHGEEFNFSGHTEYLESRLAQNDDKALMILFDGNLRVALVTTHLPISELHDNITKDSVLDTIKRLDQSLRRDFLIERPRIAILSLNPHNGDEGLIGDEEQTAIIPAIKEAVDEGIVCLGPYAADGFFGSESYRKYDGVVAMYHDQGLAPFKALSQSSGVNFTAGLPYVRTSPDHGTGYDIVGKNMADETSLRQAVYEAIDIYRNRNIYDKAVSNPLRKQYVERGADKTVDLTKDTL
ncbi:MAG: 4-hydroxythreonine-4-phosphate dehydrogenase PdxA [Prevotella sp.]|nr:4-hydroxythreonine-4-phosphate dehydrogenase PdxA [Bacteroides sp.]MCM1367091.1 4-hydroxythreonine-4-phosphate dehydrogenase PdxA [Prevotella sp.]MCM1437356.1 4-hydroxythreonine-4-phosphate dehydrogenase PdxA [Prevotella sp.]